MRQKRCVPLILNYTQNKLDFLIEIIRNNPYQIPPYYEKLTGDMSEYHSRRLNIQHRLAYQVLEEKIVKVLSIWLHYQEIKKVLEDDAEYEVP